MTNGNLHTVYDSAGSVNAQTRSFQQHFSVILPGDFHLSLQPQEAQERPAIEV
jgi:hypothetical protein